MSDEKVTSLAKKSANRENAAKSTGPKTDEGKAIVKLNGLKHGLLSKELIIREGDGKEDEADFIALFQGLQENFSPEGTIEEMLVEKVAVCLWRLRRAIRFESGMLREGLDSIYENYERTLKWNNKDVNIFDEYDALREEQERIIRENQHCIKLLKNNLDLSQLHEDKDIGMTTYYFNLIVKEYTGDDWIDSDLPEEKFSEEEMTLEEMRTFVIKKDWTDDKLRENFIQQDIDGIEEAKEKIQQLEGLKKAEELRVSRLAQTKALISYNDVDKLIRYETAIERQLYRALNQLERLQRQRAGDSVPPPISVDVNSETT